MRFLRQPWAKHIEIDTKPFQGLKREIYHLRLVQQQIEIDTKPFQGLKQIKTALQDTPTTIEIDTKPFQGLKHCICTELQKFPFHRNRYQTLSGIETDRKTSFS